jgi:hypothetical protein
MYVSCSRRETVTGKAAAAAGETTNKLRGAGKRVSPPCKGLVGAICRGPAPSAVCGFGQRVSQQSTCSNAMLLRFALIKLLGSIRIIFLILVDPASPTTRNYLM